MIEEEKTLQHEERREEAQEHEENQQQKEIERPVEDEKRQQPEPLSMGVMTAGLADELNSIITEFPNLPPVDCDGTVVEGRYESLTTGPPPDLNDKPVSSQTNGTDGSTCSASDMSVCSANASQSSLPTATSMSDNEDLGIAFGSTHICCFYCCLCDRWVEYCGWIEESHNAI